ncbi:MAG TPA: GNAT family N-acetyltransferase [Steroidobacteraceae bacterium]|jgi:GNAT superfamily N-acetyltransferase|nr:GNAT family N-acetyltransferase [Steroidobacteraceae bacterium]
MRDADLAAADEIVRTAFGTFLGLPEPRAFMGDAAFVKPRWRSNPTAAFAAEARDTLVGSNFAARWGSFGFFGPLSVRPELWDRGIGKRLLEPVMERFDSWQVTHAGLFTFAHSQKHIALYQRFGFWPRFLTAVMAKPVLSAQGRIPDWSAFSRTASEQRPALLAACREVSGALYDGLDLSDEIEAVATLNLGETALLWVDGRLAGFAVCHFGAGTEGGSGNCYVKFAAVRAGGAAAANFAALLNVCEALARDRGLNSLTAGTNLARAEAYSLMRTHGFRTALQGVAMQRPNEDGFNRSGVFIIDDWR